MDAFFHPRGVAIIGASRSPVKLASRPLTYFRQYGYRGQLYPVNPRYREIEGLHCYSSPLEVPDPVDLALVLLPAGQVSDTLRACGERGIPYVVVIASGFAEAGNRAAQDELVSICSTYGIRMVGPNCVGVVHPAEAITASFSTLLGRGMFLSGGLALVTQSGALGNSLLQTFQDLGIGIRTWVSTGNEADLGVLDFVDYLLDDSSTTAVALFLEALKDGARLVELGWRAHQRKKPLVALRAGKSGRGRVASLSHTGKLVGSAQVWKDVARQAGLVEVRTLDELADVCLGLQLHPPSEPQFKGGLGVLTVSGGLGVLISDACEAEGIRLPEFQPQTQTRFRELLPFQAAVANPVDTALFADEKGYVRCAEIVLADNEVGSILLVLSSLAHDYASLIEQIERLGHQAGEFKKWLAASYLSSSDTLIPEQRQRLTDAGILVLPTPERAVRVLGTLGRLSKWFKEETSAVPNAADSKPQYNPDAVAPAELLAAAGIPLVQQEFCESIDEARTAAARLGFPVALKIASPDLLHKTEVDGVRLSLGSEQAVTQAWQQILQSVTKRAPGARIDGMWVQEMIQGGVELILGCSVDPEFDRVIMMGAGGIWAEILENVAFRALPLGPHDAATMLRQLKVFPLLNGARGRPLMDVAAIEEAIKGLAEVFSRETWLKEVDVNPLIVLPQEQGAWAVDYLLVPGV